MKRTFMIGVAAGALLAGVNFASAQGYGQQQMPGASGGANIEQKGAVQKKGKDELKAQQGTELKGGAEVKGKRAQGGTEMQGGAEPKGKKARAQAQSGGEMKAQETPKPGEKMKGEKGKAAQTKEPKAGTAAQGEVKGGADVKGSASGAATTGQSAGGAAKASLTAEQKTKVRETVLKSGPRVTNVNFNISVGTVVPRTVRFAPLPLVLVEIYPQWRGYEYFIYEEEIIIVEPRTLKIVAVIAV